ncbi:SRPBCC family protein [Acidithiobacillus sp. 'AMD consortium']|jgi:carbon monoxide dehydrogenase subunit G|uniref:Uncharacterized protein n=2 Tax=Acidithiobacillus ferridurans TaxID=1232575 RepID=A0A2Z6IJ01_ACIFI|nr:MULTISPECIES: SRPBCC family protein [Acidithiobacillus]MBU2716524.1 SRPBCC family protein [Acidithiobacillus ferridurans]MBU2724585.1 SRPBCC family protein [Acidithiobacillus ferridurans]MBU2725929.1 SRPBCC family protein [Acidithiobacillus ferridurans]QFG77683.1 SRPBCC family protein [Acidithiobacillus sp. 'AMD consortium']BBF65512.1 hypothetical protein AFERRID_17300 [Acidithiobacillus ferridurans]
MVKVYYSSVLNQPADRVWGFVRDFNSYPSYIEGVAESVIEDEKNGDEIGAVRRFRIGQTWKRQRLTAHSDSQRSFSYAGMEPIEFPSHGGIDAPAAANYEGTLRLTPIVDGNRTFIEWFVELDCTPEDATQWNELFTNLIPKWVNSLKRALDG